MTDGTRRPRRGGPHRLAWTLSLLVALPCLAASGPAAAVDAELRSRQLYKQAEALANDGNWVEACPLFQAAHDLHGTNGTALRTADCYEKVGKYDRALGLYQYVVEHRSTDNAERVALAEGRVAALKKQLGLDQPAAPPRQGPVVAPPPPPPPKPLPPPSNGPVVVAFGVGGVGLVVGGVFGGLALKQASDVKAVCTPFVPCPTEKSAADAAMTKAWVANAGFGVFIAGAVIGGLLLANQSSPRKQAAVLHMLGPDGLKLRF